MHYGRVSRKWRDNDGAALVELELWSEGSGGRSCVRGNAIIQLPTPLVGRSTNETGRSSPTPRRLTRTPGLQHRPTVNRQPSGRHTRRIPRRRHSSCGNIMIVVGIVSSPSARIRARSSYSFGGPDAMSKSAPSWTCGNKWVTGARMPAEPSSVAVISRTPSGSRCDGYNIHAFSAPAISVTRTPCSAVSRIRAMSAPMPPPCAMNATCLARDQS